MRNRALVFVTVGVGVLACAMVPLSVCVARHVAPEDATTRAWFYVGLLQGMAFGAILFMGTYLLVGVARRSTSSRLLVAAATLPGLLGMLGALFVLYSDPVMREALRAVAG